SPDAPTTDPAATAARERFLRGLVLTGVLGIVFAGLFLARQSFTKAPSSTFTRQAFLVAPGETKILEEPWASHDPPIWRKRTVVTGEPYLWFEDDSVRVEWAIPDLARVTLFLVTGKKPGEATFQMLLSNSQNKVLFPVAVKGDSPHEQLRAERKKKLGSMTIP